MSVPEVASQSDVVRSRHAAKLVKKPAHHHIGYPYFCPNEKSHIMSFLKNIASSCLGASVAILIAGSILIFIFVGALVGGIAEAVGGIEEGERWR